MDTVKLESKVSKRLFVGCLLTSELSMHLNQSISWKHHKILANPTFKIQEVHYQGKDYFGVYLNQEKVLVSDLNATKLFLIEQIKELAPKFSSEVLSFFVFFQQFIA